MKALIISHPMIFALGVYYLFSSAISALPTPRPNSSDFFKWFFTFTHILSGNVGRIVATRGFPSVEEAQTRHV